MPRHRHDEDDDIPRVPITWGGLREAVVLLRYLLPYRLKFAAALVFLVLSNLTGLAFPFLTGRLVDASQSQILNRPAAPAWPAVLGSVNSVTLLLLAALSLQSLWYYLQTYWLVEVGERAVADLRRDSYSRLIRMPMAFFAKHRVGELTSRLTSDLGQIQSTLTGTIPQFLGGLVMLVGGVVLLAITSIWLTFIMLSSFPVVILLTAIFGRRIRGIAREGRDKLAETNVIVEETLQCIVSVKAFTNETYETGRYVSGLHGVIGAALRGARNNGAFRAFSSFALLASIALSTWYGARLVQMQYLSFGELTQFLLYTMYVGGAVGQFAYLYSQVQQTLGSTQRVRELLQEPVEIDVLPAQTAALPLIADGHGADLAFENVTFAYPEREDVTVLKEISLAARAGERIALVGPSGAGKTTIVSLLLRFYDPTAGRILVNGRDARDIPLSDLRRHMAIVPQDVLLFGGSIADNIGYGRPGSSRDEIEHAARQANAHDFIAAFPDGYETVVGERGAKLSGGQRQRVAIARAILRDPAILVLDEATSSLDSESESLVQQALDRLMRGRTSVIVAHRLSTIRQANRIYVIKEGRVVESGTHAELILQTDGVYRNLSELQFDLGED